MMSLLPLIIGVKTIISAANRSPSEVHVERQLITECIRSKNLGSSLLFQSLMHRSMTDGHFSNRKITYQIHGGVNPNGLEGD